MQTPSKDLFERFLWELSDHQKSLDNVETVGGSSLEISVGYLIDKRVVEVSVIQAATDLPRKCKQ